MAHLTVTISKSSPRWQEWMDMLGTDTVPVQALEPVCGSAPGQESKEFYLLDIHQLTDEQRSKLVKHLAATFNLPIHDVLIDVYERGQGVPILADDVTPPVIDMRFVL